MVLCAECGKECKEKRYSSVVDGVLCSVACVRKIYARYWRNKNKDYFKSGSKEDSESQGIKKACEWLNM